MLEICLATGASAVLHAAFVAYGSWQDSNMVVKYTDIDYWVFSDAAKILSEGGSPYDRPTYRYSPLLAMLLYPNNFFGELFGKTLFSILDIACMVLIYNLLVKQQVTKGKAALYSALFYGCNPMVITVSTRGNAESLTCFLNLLIIWMLSTRKRALSAIITGIGAHLRLFPVLYLPSILVFMGLFPKQQRSVITSMLSAPGTPKKAIDKGNSTINTVQIQWKHVQYVLITSLTFLSLTVATGYHFGVKGLQDSTLYHLVRKDHRHNFSAYWLMYYYNGESELSLLAASFLPFIPQAILSMMIAFVYGKKDFCFALLMQTFIFVSLNKVCTSQYFLWFLCLLPICLPSLKAAKAVDWLAIGSTWIGAQSLFLGLAYKLEFQGLPVFEQVWLASIFFAAANIWIASRLITINSLSRSKQ